MRAKGPTSLRTCRLFTSVTSNCFRTLSLSFIKKNLVSQKETPKGDVSSEHCEIPESEVTRQG